MADKQIVVKFIGDTKSFDDATKKVIGGADKVSVSMKDLSLGGMAAGAGATVAAGALGLVSSAADSAVDFLNDSVSAASNLRESMSLSKQVFEDNSGAIEAWGDTTGETLGTSKQDALDMASGFGTAFKNVGMSLDETKDKAIELSGRAVDLGSAFNTSSEDAAAALRSGLLGESEPLRKFGVFLDETKTKAWMLANGMKPVNGAFTDAQKVTARYNQILEQTSDSAGMFGRDADSLADNQKRANAAFEDAQAKLGEKLLPAMVTLTRFATDELIPAFVDMIDKVGQFGEAIDLASDMELPERLETLADWANILNPAMWSSNVLLGDLKEGMSDAEQKAADLALQMEVEKASVDPLTDSFDRATGFVGGYAEKTDEAGDETRQAIDPIKNLTDAVKNAKDPWDDLRDAVRSATDEMIDKKYAPEELAISLAIAKDDVVLLTEKLEKLEAIKNPTAEQKRDILETRGSLIDAQKEVESLTADIRTLDSQSVGRITAHMNSLGKKIDWTSSQAADLLQLLKNIDNAASSINFGGVGGIGGKAKGGPAAGLTWVGEEGPELLNLPAGSYVHSNPESMRMVTQSAITSTSRGGPGTVTININGAQDVGSIMLALRRELTRTGMTFA